MPLCSRETAYWSQQLTMHATRHAHMPQGMLLKPGCRETKARTATQLEDQTEHQHCCWCIAQATQHAAKAGAAKFRAQDPEPHTLHQLSNPGPAPGWHNHTNTLHLLPRRKATEGCGCPSASWVAACHATGKGPLGNAGCNLCCLIPVSPCTMLGSGPAEQRTLRVTGERLRRT